METNEILNNLKSTGYITIADPNENIKKMAELGESTPLEPGDAENSLVQVGSNSVAFGINSTAFGTSSTNAKERGITAESTSEEIIQEWISSDPEDQKFALTLGEGSHIEGNNCLALGKNSHAEGNGTVAGNNSSHSEGTGCVAAGKYAHAEGLETIAEGSASHSEGRHTRTSNDESHAEGQYSEANARASHAEGYKSIASKEGYSSNTLEPHAQGSGTSSWKNACSHAEGNATIAQGLGAHAEGEKTFANERATHAEGLNTTASGPSAHAEGEKTVASEDCSHAEGYNCKTYEGAGSSHVEGSGTEVRNSREHAQGSYNKSHTLSDNHGFNNDPQKTLHSVGMGTGNSNRKNAFEIMQNGLVFIYGVNGYNGTNPDSTSTGNSLQAGILNDSLTVDKSLFGWE